MDRHAAHSVTLVLAKLAWLAGVVVAMALMTKGLLDVGYFAPTDDELAEEDRARDLILIASVLLAAAAGVAHLVFRAPLSSVLVVAAPIALCWAAAVLLGFPAFAVLVLAYPAALAGAVGCLFLRR